MRISEREKGKRAKEEVIFTLESELLVDISDLGKDTNLETAHREEQLRVVLGVNRYESVIPLDGSE